MVSDTIIDHTTLFQSGLMSASLWSSVSRDERTTDKHTIAGISDMFSIRRVRGVLALG